MNPSMFEDLLVFLGLMTTIGCVTWLLRTALLRWRAPRLDSPKLDQISEQLERLQTALDATALEVERIGESQRFAVRVMSREGAQLGEGSRG